MTTSKAYWATAIGSMVGSIVGGVVLHWAANATASGELETIIYVVLLVFSGVWGGAVVGVWVALSLIHVPQVARTVVLFTGILALAIVPLLLLVNQLLTLSPFAILPNPASTLRGTVLFALGIGAIAAGVRRLSTR